MTATGIENYGIPLILMNRPCDGTYCDDLSVSNKREFKVSDNLNYKDIYQVETVNVAFFDINEDGRIDFMINSLENGVYNVRCFFNYISTDAFFLKVLGITFFCF